MRRRIAKHLIICSILLPAILLADVSFGKVTVTIDTLPPLQLNIVSAILYRQVDVVQDTVVFLSDSAGIQYLFGPQFVEGKQYVLQLHMVEEANGTQFYDVGFVLGDTLTQQLTITNEAGGVYFNPEGRLTSHPQTASHLTARFDFKELNDNVVGRFTATFFYVPNPQQPALRVPVKMEGELKAPVGTYQETSIATESENLEQKRRYQRNLGIAIIISFIMLALLGI